MKLNYGIIAASALSAMLISPLGNAAHDYGVVNSRGGDTGIALHSKATDTAGEALLWKSVNPRGGNIERLAPAMAKPAMSRAAEMATDFGLGKNVNPRGGG